MRLAAFLMLFTGISAAVVSQGLADWRPLAPGLDLGTFDSGQPGTELESKITVLRIDPRAWQFVFSSVSQSGASKGGTAREWSESEGFVAAINAGMFATDYKTHIGYARSGDHIHNSHVAEKYKSVAAFAPKVEGVPPFRIHDLDAPNITMKRILQEYGSVLQNLRLIKRPGENRWSRQEKMWSEAALGEDEEGRALFIFSRAPFTMHDFNEKLLGLGIGVVCAQHLEGGPEAQLYVKWGDLEIELLGSFESGFHPDSSNRRAWRIPNVLGIRPAMKRAGEQR